MEGNNKSAEYSTVWTSKWVDCAELVLLSQQTVLAKNNFLFPLKVPDDTKFIPTVKCVLVLGEDAPSQCFVLCCCHVMCWVNWFVIFVCRIPTSWLWIKNAFSAKRSKLPLHQKSPFKSVRCFLWFFVFGIFPVLAPQYNSVRESTNFFYVDIFLTRALALPTTTSKPKSHTILAFFKLRLYFSRKLKPDWELNICCPRDL